MLILEFRVILRGAKRSRRIHAKIAWREILR